ncbi:hypothetical protein TeGR_g10189, partial [Tetraparma gracilis]
SLVLGPPPPPLPNLAGRVHLVTGGNAGIGLETCEALCAAGGTAILMSRSRARGEAARDALRARGGRAELLVGDLQDEASVRSAAKQFEALGLPLHALVLNAGVMLDGREVTRDGHEATMAANHLGHFLLCKLLLPAMVEGGGDRRVVTVGSSTHWMAEGTGVRMDDLGCERRGYELFGQYSQSKMANLMFSAELGRLAAAGGHPNLTTYCVHPGLVRTSVHKNMHPAIVFLHDLFGWALGALMKPAEVGARTSVYCAASGEVKGETGG